MKARVGSVVMLVVLITVSVVPPEVAQVDPTTVRNLDLLPSHGSVSLQVNRIDPEEQWLAGTEVRPTPIPTPEPTPEPTPKPTRTPKPTPVHIGHGLTQLTGKASWFKTGPDGPYAAACWPLRKAMGGRNRWRGQTVLVAMGKRAVEVRLTDWCGSHDKTIDLSDESFKAFAPLSRGVIQVTVGW